MKLLILSSLVFLASAELAHAENSEWTVIDLFDNYPHAPGMETAWGFSCLVKFGNSIWLFDTGKDGGILLRNMERMHVDPADIHAVFLSHIHNDHTGGLFSILERRRGVIVYIPSSFPADFKKKIVSAGAHIHEVTNGGKLEDDFWTTGEMGRGNAENGLVLKTAKGPVLITGCAHPGIVGMIRRTQELAGQRVLIAAGGFHLRDFSEKEIAKTIEEMKKTGLERVAPGHCTGDKARELLKTAYGDHCLLLGAGMIVRP